MKTWLTTNYDLKLPIIMAPMFLVSNVEMLVAAADSGIMGCIPTLNFRTPELLDSALTQLDEKTNGKYGVNLIVNKSNMHLEKHLEIVLDHRPQFIITSLGSPKEIIKKAHQNNIAVFCDVTTLSFAKKVESLDADAIIGVNSGAGGHAGPTPATILIPLLKKNCSIPIISAGGVSSGTSLLSILTLGAQGVSMGTPFIATHESGVSDEYKQAIIDYHADDIGLTTKLSGTPCTVIKTPYVKKIGLEQNSFEKVLNNNKKLKKYVKMLTYYRGTKLLEKAALSATYKSVWCAGPSLELVDRLVSVHDLIAQLESEFQQAIEEIKQRL